MAELAENLSPLKRAILEIRELRTQLDEIDRANHEPIAVVGLGLRFPGGAHDAESFWQLLYDGVDAITEVPADRWNIDAFYDPDSAAPGKMATRFGAWLHDIDQFDAAFFGISPREALSMDPQQRLLLEVAWTALEQAGQSPERLTGSDTGMFLGIANSDYGRLTLADSTKLDTYVSTGSAFSVAAGRLSYILGLHGPTLAVDTACSSSLVAVHLACQSLRRGECRLALAGGVNVILAPEININFSKSNMLAPDGRCKTFDARADGYVRGEGCAVIVLKRLSEAVADHDHVLAIIRGSAINHDGRSGGLTVPSGPAQEAVIRAALADAQVDAAQVSYTEAHGTGTSLGDPIEVRALGAVYGRERSTPLTIGSVKTNIGHLEAAAGLAGLIKVVVMLQHREIAPHLHFAQGNPYIEWERWPFVVPTNGSPWSNDRLIAGVSSFGFSGTNAHVIIEAAPNETRQAADTERRLHLLTLSAKSEAALRVLASQVEAHVARSADSLADLCFTTNTGRSHFAHRLAILATTCDELRDRLAAFTTSRASVDVFSGRSLDVNPPEVAFLFTGYGSQYADMGRQLYATRPTFCAAIDRCEALYQAQTGESLTALLYSQSAGSTQPSAIAQSAVFALEIALAELWKSWGIVPSVVAGHSLGEYAAACVAGVFSLADGLKLVIARDRLMRSLPDVGEMMTVFADEATVSSVLAAWPEVSIAAINSPETVVISGRQDRVQQVVTELQAKRIRSRRLPIAYASHSPLIEPILDEFERIAAEVTYSTPHTALVSSLTGEQITDAEITTASYWRRHLRSTVRFAAAMNTLHQHGYRVFVEIGPNPTLASLGQRCVPESSASRWLPSLREGRADWSQMLETLAQLYVNGAQIDWPSFERDDNAPRRRVSLPTYPFEHKSYWWTEDRPYQSGAHPLEQRWNVVVAAGRRQSQQAPLDLALHTFADKWRCLNLLSTAYRIAALRELGLFTQAGEQHSLDDVMQRGNVAAQYRRLIARWLNRLGDQNLLQQQPDGTFVSHRPLAGLDIDQALNDARAALADALPLLDYVRTCGFVLTAIISGKESPLETLFPGGSFATTDFLYQNWAVPRYINGIVRAVVGAVVDAIPDRVVHIIEVGGGTGASTSFVLPALPPDRSLYHFTDISHLFLNRAKDKFAAYPFVRYSMLNIEQHPHEQGFARHGYDVVIAADVLHALPDLNRALDHIRTLLNGQGVLVLVEPTTAMDWYDTTTSLTVNWEPFGDELRRGNSVVLPEQWRIALSARGFEDIVFLPDNHSPAEVLGQCVIIARAPILDAAEQVDVLVEHVEQAAVSEEQLVQPAEALPSAFVESLTNALPDERTDLLVNFVRRSVAKVLRFQPAEALERKQRLMDLGVDSLMAVELRNLLGTGLGLTSQALPATLIFDYPTIESIATFIERDVLKLGGPPAPDREVPPPISQPVPAAAAHTVQIDELSDEEVEVLLLEKLKSLSK